MNKSLLALAITAALAVPSIAAAEVKVIGQAQLELVNTASDVRPEGITLDDGAEGGRVGSGNASALGVTGAHDLGNGLTALYKINYNFHADDADDSLSARDRFIGLKGGFGTFLTGRVNLPYKTATVKWDPFLGTFMQARGSNGMSTLHNGYADEVLAYANNFGSVKFVGAIALDENDVDPADGELDGDHALSFSLNIPAGPVEIGIGYVDVASVDDATAVKVGVKWTSGDITVAGQIEALDEGLGDTSHGYVTASFGLGSGSSISVALGSVTDESASDAKDGTYTSVGYKKALSKKVSMHAGVVVVDEGVTTADNDATQVGAGLRVKF